MTTQYRDTTVRGLLEILRRGESVVHYLGAGWANLETVTVSAKGRIAYTRDPSASVRRGVPVRVYLARTTERHDQSSGALIAVLLRDGRVVLERIDRWSEVRKILQSSVLQGLPLTIESESLYVEKGPRPRLAGGLFPQKSTPQTAKLETTVGSPEALEFLDGFHANGRVAYPHGMDLDGRPAKH